MASNKPNKLAFLSMPAPASYVAGLGRGSDIGPAREGPSAEVIAEAQAKRGEEPDVDPEQFQDPDNEYGLFAGTAYEQDDEEADKIYEAVDAAMDARRKARREAQEKAELEKFRAERPKIQQQFSDLKRGLSAVTDEEWESIPEVGNLTRRKRPKYERSFVVPDSVLVGDRSKSEYENSLDQQQQMHGGFTTPADGTMTNFVEIGQARDKILSLKLDQVRCNFFRKGPYLSISRFLELQLPPVFQPPSTLKGTSHPSTVSSSNQMLKLGISNVLECSLTPLVKSNPKHAPGWIAAACLEEHAGRMVAARKLIKQGCEQCPKNEDVWLEAARLHNNDDAKVILANAVQHVGQSVKIWLAAADLEQDVKAKRRVLRKEHIPNSVRLWKETVNLETSASDARILLSRAVEVIPLSVELWLALAQLETLEKAKAVLNKARKAIPTSHEIWIAAGRLLEQEAIMPEKSEEEKQKTADMIDKTIEAGVKGLRKHQVLLTREQWLKEAEKCEAQGSVRTCEAIVKATIFMDVEEEDRLDTWMDDAESALSRNMVGTARAILAYALKVFPDRKNLWIRAAGLEKSHGTTESLDAILERAVEHCPQAEVLWLMAAKEKWNAGDVDSARAVLARAFDANKESEQIWLAAVKLEAENNQLTIWMKSAVFERQQGQIDAALQTLATAISKFPKFAKLYMIQGQIHQSQKNYPAARGSFAAGYKACPKEPTLWILASRLEEADGKSIKARALLEKARQVNPGNDVIWAESVGVEERSGGAAPGKAMLARALQECPSSGLLWSMLIWSEPRPMRKTRALDALKKSNDSPLIICTVARLFWAERKLEKAREWFQRSVPPRQESADVDNGADIGDLWGWWLKFERQHGIEEQREAVRVKCIAAEPRHGPTWQAIAKDMKNTGKSVREILEMVADALQ
ncbi:U4/U6 x U5 tri-snRNP complex subunit Prp1 [Paramarasmius palmivorus]|uniref:U4/U6 x U5 tri-snRNP complex subunit Prp1 n=1 Tax=Paramarasmius palmivorus TaxID=297713 RepID=A0AAW0E8P1_9AGAR